MVARGLACDRTQPGRLVAALDADNRSQVWVTGLDGQRILAVQVRSVVRVPRPQWPAALRLTNEWNRRQRLTSAWLAVDDWQSSNDAGIVVEAGLPVSDDHDVEQLVEFAELAVADGCRFWRTDRRPAG